MLRIQAEISRRHLFRASTAILRDEYDLHRDYWEVKDTDDKLDSEIKKKIAKGYLLTNTIFEDTRQAVVL
jgi:hypothetical protein